MPDTFETLIRNLTMPCNGQYPRPWMTRMSDPGAAKIFVVGRNQATGYDPTLFDSHDAYLDSLFNRSGQSCRATYDRVRAAQGKRLSPTRQNLDGLTDRLGRRGVTEVIETNVICYSTPMSSDLHLPEHRGGRQLGTDLFLALLTAIRPPVLIAHGNATLRDLGRVLGVTLPQPPQRGDQGPVKTHCQLALAGRPYDVVVFALPSLAPPEWNKWSGWAGKHLDDVADTIAHELQGSARTSAVPVATVPKVVEPVRTAPVAPMQRPSSVITPQALPTNGLDGIPADVLPAWERLWQRLAIHGLETAIEPKGTRVSLTVHGRRYLKYDYSQHQWVFCLAVGDRMDALDPVGICVRGDGGTRSKNAVAKYKRDDLAPLYPVLDRLADLLVADCRR